MLALAVCRLRRCAYYSFAHKRCAVVLLLRLYVMYDCNRALLLSLSALLAMQLVAESAIVGPIVAKMKRSSFHPHPCLRSRTFTQLWRFHLHSRAVYQITQVTIHGLTGSRCSFLRRLSASSPLPSRSKSRGRNCIPPKFYRQCSVTPSRTLEAF